MLVDELVVARMKGAWLQACVLFLETVGHCPLASVNLDDVVPNYNLRDKGTS